MADFSEKSQPAVRLKFERMMHSIVCSRLRSAIVAILFGLSTLVLTHIVHLAVIKTYTKASVLADSVILGLSATFWALLVLSIARDRHHRVQDDLRRIAELNHQVRNALQVIVYGEYSQNEADHRATVLAGVERIESTLREMFPIVGDRQNDLPWEAHNRARLQSRNLDIRLTERRRRGNSSNSRN